MRQVIVKPRLHRYTVLIVNKETNYKHRYCDYTTKAIAMNNGQALATSLQCQLIEG